MEPAPRPPESAVPIVGLMITLSMANYVIRTSMSIAGPEIMREFGISATQMGTVYSAFLLSYALLMPPGGRLADQFGPRAVLAAMTVGSGLFAALTAGVGWLVALSTRGALWSFQAVRLALGAFAAPIYPACARMNANWLPPARHARVQGLVLAGAPLGSALTPLIMAAAIAWAGWRGAFGLIGAGAMLLGVVWLGFARDFPGKPAWSAGPDGEARPPVVPWRRLLRDRNLLLFSVSYFALNYFEYIFFYWMYYYLGQIRKVGATRSAVDTSVLLFVMAVAMPSGGWLSDRLIPWLGRHRSRRLVASAGMSMSAVCLYLGANAASEFTVVLLLSLALGLAAGAEGPFWAAGIEAGGDHSGAATGLMNGVGNVGGMLAPVLTPYLARQAGWAAGLHAGAGVVLAGALLWMLVRPVPAAPGVEEVRQTAGES